MQCFSLHYKEHAADRLRHVLLPCSGVIGGRNDYRLQVFGGHDLNGDGNLDLTLKFKTQDVVELLDLWSQVGQTIPLSLTGSLSEDAGAMQFVASDWVWVLAPGHGKLNGLVGVGDLGVLGAYYGSGADRAANPEPATLVLLGAAVPLVLRRQPKSRPHRD